MRTAIITAASGLLITFAAPAFAAPKSAKGQSCQLPLTSGKAKSSRSNELKVTTKATVGEVILLGRPKCPRTTQVRELLQEQGIKFTEVNVDKQRKRAQTVFQKFALDVSLLPVLVVEDSTVMDGKGSDDPIAIGEAFEFAKQRQELKAVLDSYTQNKQKSEGAVEVVTAFARATDRVRRGDAVAAVVRDAVSQIDPGALADLPSWKLSEKLDSIPGVAGVARRGETVSVYVRTPKGVRGVTVDGGSVFVEGDARLWSRVRTDLKTHSTSEMHLIALQAGEGGKGAVVHLEDGAPVKVSAEDLAELEAGRPLDSAHPLSLQMSSTKGAFVVFSTPVMQRHDAPETLFSDRLGNALQRAYPETLVLRDPFSSETKDRVAKLIAFDRAQSRKATALVARDDTVLDYKLLQNIEDDLEAHGVHVIEFDASKPLPTWSEASGRMVIVISGHSDDRLATFVREMGDAGVFRDNVVLDNSCGTPLTRQLLAEITGRYGGVSAFGYKGKILVKDVQPFLTKIAPAFGATPPADSAPSLLRFMFREMHQGDELTGSWVVSETPMLDVGAARG